MSITPQMFGAVGDGATDDLVAVQSAVDTAASIGAVVESDAGSVFAISGDLMIYSNSQINIPNATIKGIGTARAISIAGTAGSPVNLYETAQRHTRKVKVATKAVLSVDNWVCVYGSPDVDNDNSSKGLAQELAKVVAVDTAPGSYDELTLDRALEFFYPVAGVSTAAVIYPVTPIEGAAIHVGALDNCYLLPRLFRNIDLKVGRASAVNVLSQPNGAPLAGEFGRVTFASELPYDEVGGSNAHALFKGWRNLKLDCSASGGSEDGVRVANSSNVDLRIESRSCKSRSVNLYKVSGRVDASVSVSFGTGNIEHAIIDYCRDLIAHFEVKGVKAGDAIELRARNENITLDHPIVIASDENTGLVTCINIHPASTGQRCTNTRIIGGLLVGSGTYGLAAPDGWDGLIVDGLRIRPTPSAPSFAPFALATLFDPGKNTKIVNCDFYGRAAGFSIIGTADKPVFDTLIENTRIGIVGTFTVAFLIDYGKALAISRFGYLGKNNVQRIVIYNATGGTFTLAYKGQTTAAIAYNAAAADVKAALDTLNTIENVTVTGANPWTVTFGDDDFVYDKQPDLLTINGSGLTSGSTAYAFIHPQTFHAKQARIYHCSQVKLSQMERPSSAFFLDLANSELVQADDLWLIDTLTHYIHTKKPVLLDSFTDADATAIAAHVPDIGGFIWNATDDTNTTISGNSLRINSNNNQVTAETTLTARYTIDLAVTFASVSGGNWHHACLFDYADAGNKCEVRFNTYDFSIKIVETIATVETELAAYTGWLIDGVTHHVRVSVNGKYVRVKLGDAEILSAVMAGFRDKDTIGWRRYVASTGAAILNAIAVHD